LVQVAQQTATIEDAEDENGDTDDGENTGGNNTATDLFQIN
jgi:hypothetical protein